MRNLELLRGGGGPNGRRRSFIGHEADQFHFEIRPRMVTRISNWIVYWDPDSCKPLGMIPSYDGNWEDVPEWEGVYQSWITPEEFEWFQQQ